MSFFQRNATDKLLELASQFKAVAVMGPRQSGKTTLVRACFPDKEYVSLENPQMRRFAQDDPAGFIGTYKDGAILDEIQRVPELLSWLQQVLDESNERGKFILTGSNNMLLLEKITQSLAGRVAYLDLLPFSLSERPDTFTSSLHECLLYGGYPPVIADKIAPENWFPAYVRTYIEKDIRQIKNIENILVFEKMISLCAGRVGQMLNFSNLSNELGVDHKTVRSWIGLLEASYVIFLLPPYHKNFNKRIVKTPKLYFVDTGLAAWLLGIQDEDQLTLHHYKGALFENWAISEFLKKRFNQGKRSNLFFWRDSSGNEIDLILENGLNTEAIEIKSGQTIQPAFFKGLKFWEKITGQQDGKVIYGGEETQLRSNGIEVRPWRWLGE
ncbi:MAG: ATP-binding protein [Bacteroidia bacterium]